MSDGERLRRALTELGTTWVKFGQVLSLRPDVVGDDVAAELVKLQAAVAPDPPGVAQRLVESELGGSVSDLYRAFDPDPTASGSVAQVHKATLHDGTAVVVKVLHDGVEYRVLEDLELMEGIAARLEQDDPELAHLRPTMIVGEFSQMLHDAIDLSQELRNLQRFALETSPTNPTSSSPRRIQAVAPTSPHHEPDLGRAVQRSCGRRGDRMGRRGTRASRRRRLPRNDLPGLALSRHPQPGNLLLPDGSHIAILDFGDVGRISSMRKRRLEDLVIAAGTHDLDGLTDVIVEITTPPPSVDMVRLRSQLDAWLNRYLLIEVGQFDMAGIITTGMRLLHENGLVLPGDLSLLLRVMLQLQGLGRGLQTELRVTELLEPYMKKLLAERFDPRRVARHAGRTFRAWDRGRFPARRHRRDRQTGPRRQARRRLPYPRLGRRRGSSRRRPRCGRCRARVRTADLASHRPDRRVDLGARRGRRRRGSAHLATARPSPTRAQDLGEPGPRAGGSARRRAES